MASRHGERSGTGDPVVLHEDSGVIETSHSCVVVRCAGGMTLRAGAPVGNTLVTFPDAVETDQGSELWVDTADQWGPFAVTTRLWSAPPEDAGPEWEDVVELSVGTNSGLVATEMVDNAPQIVLAPEPGEYRLRVSARGRRVAAAQEDDDRASDAEQSPREWYLLELWSAPPADPEVLRLTSPFAHHVVNPPPALVIPEGEAGLAAAARIGRDVDGGPGARTLSGRTSSVRVARTMRGTRRKLFGYCAHVGSWSHVWLSLPGWSTAAGPGWDKAGGTETWRYSNASRDQLTGHGAVCTSFLVLDPPRTAVKTWNWVRRVGDRGPSPYAPGSNVLAEDSVFAVELTQSRDDNGDPWTTVAITHDGLPIEWIDDMETYWGYQLSIADHDGFGLSK